MIDAVLMLVGLAIIGLCLAVAVGFWWFDKKFDSKGRLTVQSVHEPEPDRTPHPDHNDWQAQYEEDDLRHRYPSGQDRQDHPEGS
jgi:hypothetical protein